MIHGTFLVFNSAFLRKDKSKASSMPTFKSNHIAITIKNLIILGTFSMIALTNSGFA
jgi:hypothetical protein